MKARVVELILSSSHNCALLFLGASPATELDAADWLGCMYFSLWKLNKLLPSSSVMLGGLDAAEEGSEVPPSPFPSRSAFLC